MKNDTTLNVHLQFQGLMERFFEGALKISPSWSYKWHTIFHSGSVTRSHVPVTQVFDTKSGRRQNAPFQDMEKCLNRHLVCEIDKGTRVFEALRHPLDL